MAALPQKHVVHFPGISEASQLSMANLFKDFFVVVVFFEMVTCFLAW